MSLNYIKDRVWGKLQGWKEKLLSQVENEVLLKAMVQVIPTFAMSCFKLPIGLFQDIEMLIQKCWWDQRGERRKIHWRKWEVLCQPKLEVGLGFKDLCKFNEAMLAKQVWHLIHDIDSLFYSVSRQNTFQIVSFLKQSLPQVRLHGKIFCTLEKLLQKRLVRELEMVSPFVFFLIIGF